MLSSTRKKSARGMSCCPAFTLQSLPQWRQCRLQRRVHSQKSWRKDAPSPSADKDFELSPMPSDGEGIKILDLSYDYFFFFILPLAVTSNEPLSQVPSPFPTGSTVIFSDLMVSVANSPPLAPPSTSSRITFSRFSL